MAYIIENVCICRSKCFDLDPIFNQYIQLQSIIFLIKEWCPKLLRLISHEMSLDLMSVLVKVGKYHCLNSRNNYIFILVDVSKPSGSFNFIIVS